jgi:hypothetical protein
MFTKLLLVITLIGATACILLVNRQQRIETANEIAQIHRRLLECDQAMWTMRNEIASRCTPDKVRAAMSSLQGDWRPIPTPPTGEQHSVAQFAPHEPDQSVKIDAGG